MMTDSPARQPLLDDKEPRPASPYQVDALDPQRRQATMPTAAAESRPAWQSRLQKRSQPALASTASVYAPPKAAAESENHQTEVGKPASSISPRPTMA